MMSEYFRKDIHMLCIPCSVHSCTLVSDLHIPRLFATPKVAMSGRQEPIMKIRVCQFCLSLRQQD